MSYNTINRNFGEVEKEEVKKGLKIHGTVCICVIALLTLINFIVCPEFLWFVFPLFGMSIGFLVHYLLGMKSINQQ